MSIGLYYVNPGERDWAKCFQPREARQLRSLDEVGNRTIYAQDKNSLVIIHLSPPARGAQWLQNQWESLPTDTRMRVLWLVVMGGSGYRARETWSDHVHFLHYPLDAETLKREEVKACFQKFVMEIGREDHVFSAKDWELLYPPENIALVALLATLSAAKFCNVQEQLQTLVGEYENRGALYRQYMARVSLSGLSAELTEGDIIQLAQDGASSKIAEKVRIELKRVLGTAPD